MPSTSTKPLPPPPKGQVGVPLSALSKLPPPPTGQKGLSLEQLAPPTTLGQKLGARFGQLKASTDILNPIRKNVRVAGAIAGGINDVIGSALAPVINTVKPIVAPAGRAVASLPGAKPVGNALSTMATGAGRIFNALPETTQQDARDAGNIASLLPVGKLTPLAKPVAKSTLPVGGNVVSNKLKDSALDNVSKVLAPTTKANKVTTERIAPEILKRPLKDTFAFTRTGLEAKATAGKEAAGNAINDYGDLKGSTPTKSVIESLEAEKSQYSAGGKVVNEEAVNKLTKVQEIISQYGDEMDNNTLREVRRIFDAEIQRSKGFQLPPSEGSMIDAKKIASDKIRGLLAQADPNLDKINKEYTFWKNFEGVISDTNTRKVGQAGLIDNLTTIAGAASGNGLTNMAVQALTFRWLGMAVRSPGWRLASAKIKNSIADSIAQGDFTKARQQMAIISPNIAMQVAAQEIPYTPTNSQTAQTTIPTARNVNID